jgi:hypothetical protein
MQGLWREGLQAGITTSILRDRLIHPMIALPWTSLSSIGHEYYHESDGICQEPAQCAGQLADRVKYCNTLWELFRFVPERHL